MHSVAHARVGPNLSMTLKWNNWSYKRYKNNHLLWWALIVYNIWSKAMSDDDAPHKRRGRNKMFSGE